jgi:hypothetical protein
MNNPAWSEWNKAFHIAISSYDELDAKYIIEKNVGPFQLALGFQGTSTLRDLLYDADLALVPCAFLPHSEIKKLLVHRGFQNQYMEIRELIHEEIKENLPEAMLVSGHSLGGALSSICALDVAFNFPDVETTCVTFGSPKYGNDEFNRELSRRVPNYTRFVHEHDPVVRYPFVGPYTHTGEFVQLKTDPTPRGFPNPLTHHAMRSYQTGLRKHLYRTPRNVFRALMFA